LSTSAVVPAASSTRKHARTLALLCFYTSCLQQCIMDRSTGRQYLFVDICYLRNYCTDFNQI
jgi:hypothetical protein